MTSRRIGEPNTRIRFSNPKLKIKEPAVKFTPANLAVAAKPDIPSSRAPNSMEVAHGWFEARVEADPAFAQEVDLQELRADCDKWCDDHGFRRVHETVMGRMLRHRGCRNRKYVRNMVSGLRWQ